MGNQTPWSIHAPNRGKIEKLLDTYRGLVGKRGCVMPIHQLLETSLETSIYYAQKGQQCTTQSTTYSDSTSDQPADCDPTP